MMRRRRGGRWMWALLKLRQPFLELLDPSASALSFAIPGSGTVIVTRWSDHLDRGLCERFDTRLRNSRIRRDQDLPDGQLRDEVGKLLGTMLN